MSNENNALLCVYIAETDELLKALMEQNGDSHRISVLRYPETQKSPKEQAHVADVLVDLLKKGHNQVVYTHSDHVINRLVYHIVADGVEGDALGVVNMVKIFFATEENGRMVVKEIELDSVYGIYDYPKGFFDQYADEQEAILRTALHKMQNLSMTK